MDKAVFREIRRVFGRYKAEWLHQDLFELFQQPGYFPELEEARPSVLEGGRGTGKTTALQSLSYLGIFERGNRNPNAIKESDYLGIYWCVDTNRVGAFRGSEITDEEWGRLFGHYFNLVIVGQLCELANWLQKNAPHEVAIPPRLLRRVSSSLNLKASETVDELEESVDAELIQFEASINAVLDADIVRLSLLGPPIEYMVEALWASEVVAGKMIYIILDEFENLSDYQQVMINTLIKHARNQYTFKIGVKEGGWRNRQTTSGEILQHPADYDRISISASFREGSYHDFARGVCDARLVRAMENVKEEAVPRLPPISTLFEKLSPAEEAELLGVNKRVEQTRLELNSSEIPEVSTFDDLELFYIQRLARTKGKSVVDMATEFAANDSMRQNFKANYRNALLYTVAEQSGRGFVKYYSGWQTLVRVSGGNIRYLMEIVERSFEIHAERGKRPSEAIEASAQTQACIAVGKKYSQEVQALDARGSQLTHLLLGLGRLFNQLARNNDGRQPDTTSFLIRRPSSDDGAKELDKLLKAAVMHQVLRHWPATKATSGLDVKEDEFGLHPIFSAFFVYPYQKKRRLRLDGDVLLLMARDLRAGLARLMQDRYLPEDHAEDMPSQLTLFESAYG